MKKKIALFVLVILLILLFGIVPAWTTTNSEPRYIPDDTEVGIWNPNNRIYTLTGDVNESIEITQNNLIVDGSGYKITGPGSGNGIYLNQRTNVTVKNCVFSKFLIGIFLSSCSSSTLTNNTTNSNSYGIFLNSCSSSTLTNNTINKNKYGIKLYNCSFNKVYNNNFIDNLTQARVNYGSDNTFFLDKLVGGNHWSDWTSPDDDGNYFVDYSYLFLNGQDIFPWIYQDGWKNIRPVADAGPNQKVLVGETIQFDGSGSYDTDGFIVSYEWIFGDGTNGSGMIVNHTYYEAGICVVTLVISDDGGYKDTATVEIVIQTPAEAIGDLIITIENFKLSKGVQQSLTVLLENAINSLESYHEKGAIGKLNGIIHHIEGIQNSKKLTKEQGNTIVTVVQRIINSIHGWIESA